MARLFVAVWPPDEVLDLLGVLPRPQSPDLRWTDRAQWHVTLRFLGQIDEVDSAVVALGAVRAPAALAVMGPAVSRFGARILHVPVSGLDDVASAVAAATAALGEPSGDRPFRGHLTLARVRGGRRADLRPLTGAAIAASWTATEVCMVESRPQAAGARYQVVARVPLRSTTIE